MLYNYKIGAELLYSLARVTLSVTEILFTDLVHLKFRSQKFESAFWITQENQRRTRADFGKGTLRIFNLCVVTRLLLAFNFDAIYPLKNRSMLKLHLC